MAIFADPKLVYKTKVKTPAGAERLATSGAAELDINQDGYLDYVVSRSAFPTAQSEVRLEIILGQKGGGFVSGDVSAFKGTVPTVIGSQFLVVADFNGDGHDDVFLPEYGIDASPQTGHTNTLLLWDNGELKKAPAGSLPSDFNLAHSAYAGDIDGDDDVDIFVAAQWGEPNLGSHFLINDGSGKFTRDMTIIPDENYYHVWAGAALYDFDNDGDTDIWMGIDGFKGAVLRNDGTGRFEEASEPVSRVDIYCRQIFTMDINHDGLMDVVHLGADGTRSDRALGLYINRGNLQFADESSSRLYGFDDKGDKTFQHLNQVQLGDFNGDGAVDLLVEFNGDAHQVMLNTGDGVFFAPKDARVPLFNGGGHVEVGDYNKDGKDDLLVFENDFTDVYLLAWQNKPTYPLTGSSAKDKLFGDARANTMDGKAGNDAIRSGAGKDKTKGGDGNDMIDAGSGKDQLDGGLGKDTLIGGAGADKFVFSVKPAGGNADKIKDFVHGQDRIVLDHDAFKGLKAGALHDARFFAAPGAVAAQDGKDRVIYNETSGKLYFDDDGAGGHAAVLIATLKGKPLLDADDFLIV